MYTDTASKYNENNCRRCPIVGHSEISGATGKTKNALWKVHSGFFFPPNEKEIVYNDLNEDIWGDDEMYRDL